MMKKSLLSEEFDMKSRRSVPTMFTRSPRTTVLLGSNLGYPASSALKSPQRRRYYRWKQTGKEITDFVLLGLLFGL